jgi:hypothetical protein
LLGLAWRDSSQNEMYFCWTSLFFIIGYRKRGRKAGSYLDAGEVKFIIDPEIKKSQLGLG